MYRNFLRPINIIDGDQGEIYIPFDIAKRRCELIFLSSGGFSVIFPWDNSKKITVNKPKTILIRKKRRRISWDVFKDMCDRVMNGEKLHQISRGFVTGHALAPDHPGTVYIEGEEVKSTLILTHDYIIDKSGPFLVYDKKLNLFVDSENSLYYDFNYTGIVEESMFDLQKFYRDLLELQKSFSFKLNIDPDIINEWRKFDRPDAKSYLNHVLREKGIHVSG
jgi:hypothetical protein